MRWLKLLTLVVIALLLMTPSPALADTSAGVTVTAVGYVCEAPGDFTLTYVSDYEVGISWTKGADAENTMVRAAVGRLPESRADGYLVYYGDGTFTSDWSNNLDLLDTPVYYRAWSESANSTWEEAGVSDFLGGVGMTILAVAIIVLGLTIAAFVFKNVPLLLASTMGWIVFAFLMYGKVFDNAALNTALLMFGGAMALICLFSGLGMYSSRRTREPNADDDYEAYKREVIKATRRR